MNAWLRVLFPLSNLKESNAKRTMFFYSTIKSYAEPWIDKVSSALTETTRVEHAALTQRLAVLETMLTRDFSIAEDALQSLDGRLQTLETTEQHSLDDLGQRIDRIVEQQAVFANEICRLQQRVINIEGNDRRLPSAVAERDLQPLKQRLQNLEETTKSTSNNETDVVSLTTELVMLRKLSSTQESTIAQLQATINEQITGPMLRLMDRGSELDTRVTALEGGFNSDKLERENSKLKRKSFLSLPLKTKVAQ